MHSNPEASWVRETGTSQKVNGDLRHLDARAGWGTKKILLTLEVAILKKPMKRRNKTLGARRSGRFNSYTFFTLKKVRDAV